MDGWFEKERLVKKERNIYASPNSHPAGTVHLVTVPDLVHIVIAPATLSYEYRSPDSPTQYHSCIWILNIFLGLVLDCFACYTQLKPSISTQPSLPAKRVNNRRQQVFDYLHTPPPPDTSQHLAWKIPK